MNANERQDMPTKSIITLRPNTAIPSSSAAALTRSAAI